MPLLFYNQLMKYAIITTTVFCVFAARQALAHNSWHPIENFTRSLSALYSALDSCSSITPGGNSRPIASIRAYLSRLYPDEIPYWVIPRYSVQIEDENQCQLLINTHIINYVHATKDFTRYYPETRNQMPPPMFIDSSTSNNYQIDPPKQKRRGVITVRPTDNSIAIDKKSDNNGR